MNPYDEGFDAGFHDMPEHYHTSVNRARRWLRDDQEMQRIAAE